MERRGPEPRSRPRRRSHAVPTRPHSYRRPTFAALDGVQGSVIDTDTLRLVLGVHPAPFDCYNPIWGKMPPVAPATPTLRFHVTHIVGWRSKGQMFGVDTRRIVTRMHDHGPSRNRPVLRTEYVPTQSCPNSVDRLQRIPIHLSCVRGANPALTNYIVRNRFSQFHGNPQNREGSEHDLLAVYQRPGLQSGLSYTEPSPLQSCIDAETNPHHVHTIAAPRTCQGTRPDAPREPQRGRIAARMAER